MKEKGGKNAMNEYKEERREYSQNQKKKKRKKREREIVITIISSMFSLSLPPFNNPLLGTHRRGYVVYRCEKIAHTSAATRFF